ncbi:prepilin-type N-terminal cleavage/methylation domain-containing protein [Draconibacterium sp. IB214405]|uniref:PulJ/GspJ family protein n=1 Tax=Draconibacterium sp. IB214405 TaxID=3097352 RepID=UPI002A0F5DEC|nr:prepilin-type N-terminal cleavage/methylation domain-containing protein [Draconibacterium sp. IB214405]MDX8341690.1 prepilin-type N-terminal cleavage/methylation domain-containing protein [Draconibacterium sp. IB214405]
MKRINAYTLIELTVSLVVGSLLIIFIWTGYNFITEKYNEWNYKNQWLRDIVLLDRQLRSDIKNAYMVVGKGNTINIHRGDSIEITYEINHNSIIRNTNGRRDNFDLNITNISYRYLELSEEKSFTVSSINMVLQLPEEEELKLVFRKEYDSKFRYNSLNR